MNSNTKSSPLHFSLTPHIYAAVLDEAVIILDSKTDKYLSLIDDAAKSLIFILEHTFFCRNDNEYYPVGSSADDNYNYWISYFIEKDFITPGTKPTSLVRPLQSGGLIEYRWDFKKSWKPFAQAHFIDVIKAYGVLHKVHRIMKKQGIAGIINAIQIHHTARSNPLVPSEQQIQALSAAVDAASLLYHKRTLCLAWAAAFTILALRRNWKINLAIGVQTNPFYAHAWAETCAGKVINDNPEVAQALAILFKEPYK